MLHSGGASSGWVELMAARSKINWTSKQINIGGHFLTIRMSTQLIRHVAYNYSVCYTHRPSDCTIIVFVIPIGLVTVQL